MSSESNISVHDFGATGWTEVGKDRKTMDLLMTVNGRLPMFSGRHSIFIPLNPCYHNVVISKYPNSLA